MIDIRFPMTYKTLLQCFWPSECVYQTGNIMGFSIFVV